MSAIQISNLEFYYDEYYHNVFENVNLNLDTSWKLGLIGRNGRGKSTLLKLLHGMLKPTKGNVHVPVETEFFPYEVKDESGSVLKVVRGCIAEFDLWEEQMRAYEKDLDESNMQDYGDVLDLYIANDGYIIDQLIAREFSLMELDEQLLEREYETLSGGEKTKIQIIALFLRKNHFLLIDEPTNHLDMEGIDVLANYFDHKNGFIVVSHDRKFVDRVSDHILSINKSNIYIEKGTYSSWQNNKDLRDEYERNKSKKLKREINHLEKAAAQRRTWSFEKEAEKIGCRGDKGAIGAKAAKVMKRALAIEHRMNKNIEDKKNLLKNIEVVSNIIVKQDDLEEEKYLEIKNLGLSYGTNKIIENLSAEIRKGDRIWISGENGAGKTTLLKAICGELAPSEGKIEYGTDIRIGKATQTPRWQDGFLLDRLKEEGVERHMFQMCMEYFDIGEEYFTRPIELFSEGEKKKIDIARSLMARNHILIWDEPLNYIDITTRTQIERAILEYQPTMIFVEHDQYFAERICTGKIAL